MDMQVCECVGECSPNCLNRVLHVECVGIKGSEDKQNAVKQK